MSHRTRSNFTAVQALALACALALAGCTTHATADDPTKTLSVLAGSELQDIEPLLPDLESATGVRLRFEYVGTLVGADEISAGRAVDAAWFAQDKYLSLGPGGKRVRAHERIMLSPVVLGVRKSVADRLGWSKRAPHWNDVAQASARGAFRYAMTNPTTSNSGFSAVLSAASAISRSGDVLKPSEVNEATLRGLYRGQTITSGSTGWLSTAFARDPQAVDGIVTYEASLIALQQGEGSVPDPLVEIVPIDGTITADYPLDLINEAKRPAFEATVKFFRSVQARIADETHRRPVVPGVPTHDRFLDTSTIAETAFPATQDAVDALLVRFLSSERRPAHSFYVLDKTGSMEAHDASASGDSRIAALTRGVHILAGADASKTGRFARLQDRERATFIYFSDRPEIDRTFEVHGAGTNVFPQIRKLADGVEAGGGTAIFAALEAALHEAARDESIDRGRYVSVVLMTDGANNIGDDFAAFERKLAASPEYVRNIRIFPIGIGEADMSELGRIADLTHGRAFDARKQDLASILEELRGYQ